jgi:hypothetical protein
MSSLDHIQSEISRLGYAFSTKPETHVLLTDSGLSINDWPAFAESWNDLEIDTYLLQKGRFRRRRHAVMQFSSENRFVLLPHQPHYQSENYNALQGGIQRWFSPIKPEVLHCSSMQAILAAAAKIFTDSNKQDPSKQDSSKQYRVELHQFRIEAFQGEEGQPTPEGMHRDGVDYVLVLLVRRENIESGTTLIGHIDGSYQSSFTLTEPMDAAWVDDHRVAHAVTPVTPHDPSQPAYRDVLVVTFRQQ